MAGGVSCYKIGMEMDNGKTKSIWKILSDVRKTANVPALGPEGAEELWRRIDKDNKRFDSRRRFTWWAAAGIAASVCLVASVAWFALMDGEKTVDYAAILDSGLAPVELDASGNVQLILSDNKKIAIEGKETKVEYRGEGQVNINSEEKVDISAEGNAAEEAFNQLVVPHGKRSTITFSDGTHLWVNAGSRIVYPVNFDTNKREIYAEGEVYLDVAPDSKRPFIVKTKQMQVRVIGTSFNISAYDDEPEQRVVLVSGKVGVSMGERGRNFLSPNQMFSYNTVTKDMAVSNIDVSDYIAWKDGYYQFQQQSLPAVFNKLTKYYGITFTLDEELRTMSCSGKLDLKDDIGKVLLSLQKAAPIEIDNTNETYHIKVKP